MPSATPVTITLSSPYGPAAYTVFVGDQGEVNGVESAAGHLPETVFRLTYGERWEAARAHFQDLAALLVFQAEAAVGLSDPPAEFKALRKKFRDVELPATDAPHRQRMHLWRANPAFTPALFRQAKLPRAMSALHQTLTGTDDPGRFRVLAPWLFALLPFLYDVGEREAAYHNLALMRTQGTREFLFGELERPGRHIYATGLLRSLRHFRSEEDLQRLLDLYPWLKSEAGLMTEYMALLGRFPDARVHERLLTILNDFPAQATDVLRTLREADHPDAYAVIRERFDEETDVRVLDQLAELTNDAPDPTRRVSLEEMNTKMATPIFSEGPPVTWPQGLGVHWSRLVTEAGPEEVLAEVEKYLHRPEPRLQRNALLQLKNWAKRQPFPPALPPAVEDRLRELISARFDKIFTVALDIVAAVIPSLARPDEMVDALLRHSLVSRYRLMDAAALKKAALQPDLRERQLSFYLDAITGATTAAELERVGRIIPYVNFLNARLELEKKLAEQKDKMK